MNGAVRGFSEKLGPENQYFSSEFHQLSHDLRTPLNSINGFAELLLMDEGLSPASVDYVRAILTGSQALTDAVVTYLDRAEERRVDAAPAPLRTVASDAQPASLPSRFTRMRRAATTFGFRRAERSGAL